MPNSRFAQFGDVRVSYETVGHGSQALILIHGWGGSVECWRQSIGEFPDCRVVAVDLPGHGRSDKPRGDYTMDYFARSVECVLDDGGVEKGVLVGHSMGTPIIRQFYRLFQNRTLGLVAVDGALYQVHRRQEGVALAAAGYRAYVATLSDALLKPMRDEKLRSEIRLALSSFPEYVGSSALAAMADEKIWTTDRIDVPVLAIFANQPWWPPENEATCRSIAPELEYQMWPDVSHFLMRERPSAFNEAVRQFVSGHELL